MEVVAGGVAEAGDLEVQRGAEALRVDAGDLQVLALETPRQAHAITPVGELRRGRLTGAPRPRRARFTGRFPLPSDTLTG